MGMGYAINQGLKSCKYEHIAYLPSDDFYFEEHLDSLKNKFEETLNAVLVFSGVQIGTNDTMSFIPDTITKGIKKGNTLQLVQTLHKKTSDRWVERSQFVTEDLFLMFWNKLLTEGVFVGTSETTCFWTNHPFQRHKLISENFRGGLNFYRQYYQVKTPVKLKASKYKFINEEKLYENFRKPFKKSKNSLKILLVGELAYNPERIYALEEAGHELYGLWTKPSFSFNTVGPIPFGHIKDIPFDEWEEKVDEIKPDIIYALLNFGSVELAHHVF
jgi:hypothetical protein